MAMASPTDVYRNALTPELESANVRTLIVVRRMLKDQIDDYGILAEKEPDGMQRAILLAKQASLLRFHRDVLDLE